MSSHKSETQAFCIDVCDGKGIEKKFVNQIVLREGRLREPGGARDLKVDMRARLLLETIELFRRNREADLDKLGLGNRFKSSGGGYCVEFSVYDIGEEDDKGLHQIDSCCVSMEPYEWRNQQRHKQMGYEEDSVRVVAYHAESRSVEGSHAPDSDDAGDDGTRGCQLLEQIPHLHEIVHV